MKSNGSFEFSTVFYFKDIQEVRMEGKFLSRNLALVFFLAKKPMWFDVFPHMIKNTANEKNK